MKTRKVIKGEKHHWWPKAISKFWESERGLVQRIDSSEKVVSSKGKEFGQISGGHNMLFERVSPWQSTIEHYFDDPDRNMSSIIEWLASLKSEVDSEGTKEKQDLNQERESENLDILRECIISLVVRAPKFRNSLNSSVESIRGKLDKSESKRLIASNIHQKYKALIKSSKGVGKFALLFSDEYEFIYGDGVYSNITPVTEQLHDIKLVIPLTPDIAVVWSSPMVFQTYPRIMSIVANKEIVAMVNNSVQVYSKDYLFFREQKPDLIGDFKIGEHRVYSHQSDPVGKLVDSLIEDESSKYF